MILFLYGVDTFRSQRNVEKFVSSFKEKTESGLFSYVRFNFEESDFQMLKNEIQTISMFQQKKCIIVENIFEASKEKRDLLEEFLESEGEKLRDDKLVIVLLWEKGSIKKNINLFKYIEKYSYKSNEFEALEGDSLVSFISQEVRALGGVISKEAVLRLIKCHGSDLWAQENEIKKLVAYKKGELIKSEDVEALVVKKVEENIFQFAQALAENDKKMAYSIIKNRLQAQESPQKIIGALVFQIRALLIVKDLLDRTHGKVSFAGPAKELGMSPWILQKNVSLANAFSLKELEVLYQKLANLDVYAKIGQKDAALALEEFVLTI